MPCNRTHHRDISRQQDTQHAVVPDTTCNQLGVLTAVVEDQDRRVSGKNRGSHDLKSSDSTRQRIRPERVERVRMCTRKRLRCVRKRVSIRIIGASRPLFSKTCNVSELSMKRHGTRVRAQGATPQGFVGGGEGRVEKAKTRPLTRGWYDLRRSDSFSSCRNRTHGGGSPTAPNDARRVTLRSSNSDTI